MDYPAAHSMDTEWFAVDEEGRLAFFHSGEEGAVPKFAKHEDDAIESVEKFKDAMVAFAVNRGLLGAGMHLASFPMEQFVLMVIGPGMSERNRFWEIHNEERFCWTTTAEVPGLGRCEVGLVLVYPDDHADDHRSGACLSCALLSDMLYLYGCDEYGEEREGMPYKRLSVPGTPMMAEDVPQDRWSMLAERRLPGASFDAEVIQAMEHVDCREYRDQVSNWTPATPLEPPKSRAPASPEAAPRQVPEPKARPWWKFW